jgi:hypothetical protein
MYLSVFVVLLAYGIVISCKLFAGELIMEVEDDILSWSSRKESRQLNVFWFLTGANAY